MQPPIGHVYGYELGPIDGGTHGDLVLRLVGHPRVLPGRGGDIFPVISETNLRATLGILARTVAPGQPARAPP